MKKNKTFELLQIAHLGNPIIRAKTKEIKKPFSKDLQTVIDSMIETCLEVPGVGLAAPQVYKKLRMFIMIPPSKGKTQKPIVVINPKIVTMSKDTKKDWEGCLSIPGIRALVPRYKTIKVEYIERTGRKTKKIFKNFVARIFQHEYDHLDGIVFLDRIESAQDIITEKEYQKMLRKKK